MSHILATCVIIHKVMIEDECNLKLEPRFEDHVIEMNCGLMFQQYKDGIEERENCDTHFRL